MFSRHTICSAILLCTLPLTHAGCNKSAVTDREAAKVRKAEYPVDELFISRWSPRAMSGEKISDKELMSLIEAARWAPSSYNDQPWKFVFAHRDTPEWNNLFSTLVPFNQAWCKNGAALVVIVSRTTFEQGDKPNGTHSFDTGSAWQNFALQGFLNGLVVHGIAGFDYAQMAKVINLPEGYTIEAMAVVGKPAPKSVLSEDMQKAETPSNRKPISEIAVKGAFTK
jgi:nitroreductase